MYTPLGKQAIDSAQPRTAVEGFSAGRGRVLHGGKMISPMKTLAARGSCDFLSGGWEGRTGRSGGRARGERLPGVKTGWASLWRAR